MTDTEVPTPVSANSSEILIYPEIPALVTAVAERLLETSRAAIARHGQFAIALSGGSTPNVLYAALTSDEWRSKFEWDRFRFFFGDDRAVHPSDELSNYRQARQRLFEPLGIPESKVARMVTEANNLDVAAQEYEAHLRALRRPLDLVLLGLGDDGHTASLFPHSPQLEVKEQLCVATPVSTLQPFVRRITLTYTAINRAEAVWFLVTGANKAQKVEAVFNKQEDVASLPASGIAPANGRLVWFLDEPAAGKVRDIAGVHGS